MAMEATAIARALLEPVPANALLGIWVEAARNGAATVRLDVRPELTNVVDALHASGLVALVDAAGLAAVLSVAERPDQLTDVVPLGSDADLSFYSPARGELTALCELDDSARELAREILHRTVRAAGSDDRDPDRGPGRHRRVHRPVPLADPAPGPGQRGLIR